MSLRVCHRCLKLIYEEKSVIFHNYNYCKECYEKLKKKEREGNDNGWR